VHSPTIKTTTNTQLHSTYQTGTHWYLDIFGSEAMENVLGDFASDGSDFDAADGNSCEDYYSDDDNLFSLDDVSHSEFRDIRKVWNARTAVREPIIPTEIITENGPKSSNSAQCNEDHSNDNGDEIPKGCEIRSRCFSSIRSSSDQDLDAMLNVM